MCFDLKTRALRVQSLEFEPFVDHEKLHLQNRSKDQIFRIVRENAENKKKKIRKRK